MVACNPLLEEVLSGTDGVGSAGLVALCDHFGAHKHAGRVSQGCDEGTEGLGKGNLYGIVVYDIRMIDHVAKKRGPLKAQLLVAPTVKVCLGCCCVHGSAVGEGDTLTNVKGILRSVVVCLIALCQHGDDLHVVIEAEEAVHDQSLKTAGQGVGSIHGIQGGEVHVGGTYHIRLLGYGLALRNLYREGRYGLCCFRSL